MDLGLMKFRCQGQNILHGAIHPDHGLAWTEGKGIYLTPISLYQGQVENQEHSKLGEFDPECNSDSRGVKSIHWSDNISDKFCYMCVVHDKNISIWKVEGHQPRLSFKQVRKVNIQPIAQGCLWNPGRDILCALCPQQSSLYYSHLQNKGSQVLLQLERDKIRCGCWLSDGSRLVLCVGTTLMIYHWSNIDSSVTQYTVVPWTVPGLAGRISTVVSVSNTRVIYAAELPLESLCKLKDTFQLPDLLNTNSNGPITGSVDETDIIRPRGQEESVTQTLFNIPRNPETVIEDCSRLDCIELQEDADPRRVGSVKVKGILTPDILLYSVDKEFAVVGSNAQTLLHVFSLTEDQFTKTTEIDLNRDERPKGIACLPKPVQHETGVVILVGRKDPSDAAFPASSNFVNMKSVLKFFSLKPGRFDKAQLTHTKSAPSIPLSVATNGHHDNHKDYDLITQSVINFDTNIRTSLPNVHNKENSSTLPTLDENGISKLPVGHSRSVCSAPNEGMPEPPKRPVRKKKSFRGEKSVLEKSSNAVESVIESSSKMPMEYLSDSPEMSPRENLKSDSKNVSQSNSVLKEEMESVQFIKPNSESVHTDTSTSETNNLKSSHENNENHASLKEESTSSANEDSPRDITLNINSSVPENKPFIAVLDVGESSDSKELEVETVDFNSQESNFNSAEIQNLCAEESENENRVHEVLSRKMQSIENQSIPKLSMSLESLEDIDKILKEQNEKINNLQEQMIKLSRRVDESSCVLPARYQSSNKPDVVHIGFRCKDGFVIKKTFLLDNGRLQLEEIKRAFSLSTVEIFIDDEPCVTGCNIDGYIPMRFQPGATIYIGGYPAMT